MKQIGPSPVAGNVAVAGARRSSPPTVWIVLLVVVVAAWLLLRPHENKAERLATDVTQAIAKNDMRPVEKDFNALRRPQLEDRAKVGRLSNDVIALGALKSIKEDTPKDSPAGYHHFTAQFDKATWVEDLTLDGDGKISAFHIHDPATDAGK